MAFPIIDETDSSIQATNTTSHVITMSSTLGASDIMLVVFTYYYASTGITWTNRVNLDVLSYGGVYYATHLGIYAIAFKIITVGQPFSLTINTTDNVQSAHVVYRISGANLIDMDGGGTIDTFALQAASGNSTNADPPSLTPAFGLSDYLWIAAAGFVGTINASSYPTNFSSNVSVTSANATGVSLCTVQRSYRNTGAYDPTVFTSASDYWATLTIGVNPILGAGLATITYTNISRV